MMQRIHRDWGVAKVQIPSISGLGRRRLHRNEIVNEAIRTMQTPEDLRRLHASCCRYSTANHPANEKK